MKLLNKYSKLLVKCTALLFLLNSSPSFSQKTLPKLVIQNINGEVLDINKISSNQIILISFWATWCKPCIDELDIFSAWHENLEDKYQTKYLAISIDDSRSYSRVIPMVNGKNWDFNVAIDLNQSIKRSLGILVIPHSVLLYKNKIIYEHTGFVEGDEDVIIAKIKAINEI